MRIGVVALLFDASALLLLGGLPDAIHLLALAGSEVLSPLLSVVRAGAGVEVLVLVFAVYALLEGGDPAVDLLLRFGETALNVATDLGQVVVEEAVLAILLAVARALLVGTLTLTLVVTGLLTVALVRTLVVVVLCESTSVHLVGFKLVPRLLLVACRARRLRRRSFFGFEVWIGHTEESIKGRFDFAAAGHEDSFDDFGVDGRESLDQRVLCLRMRTLRTRRLRGRNFIALLLKGHARLRRG